MSSAVPEGWSRKPLSDLLVVPPKTREVSPQKIELLTVKLHGRGVVRSGKYPKPTANGRPYFRRFSGELLIGRQNLHNLGLGIVKSETDGLIASNAISSFTGKDGNVSFLHQLMSAEIFQHLVNNSSSGTGQKEISEKQILQLHVTVPPLPEQKKIASILTSVDEVIENTQKQIDKLQDLKKATMNELLTKGIGHTEFKDSELGRIPKSWEIFPLGQLASIQTGIAKNSKQIEDAIVVPYLRVANVQDGYLDLTEIKTIEIPKSKFSRYLLQKGDVLMNEGGDFDKLGRGTVWQDEIADCVHQNHVFAVRPDQTILMSEYLKFVAGSEYGKRYFIDNSKQSTNLASINSAQLKEMPIPLASLAEQKSVIMNLKSIESLVEVRQKKLSQTQSLKKSLMQDLLTGKVRVTVN